MDYSLLTEQQLQKRQYNLPDNIREVLGSEKEIETIRQICRNHYLIDNEKIIIVEQLVGLVLLGFVPVDNLSREISENIHLNKKHADDIVIEIDRKIFNSIRADLEKFYSPVSEGEAGVEKIDRQPATDNLRQEEQSIPIEIKKPEAPIKIIGIEETTDDQRPMTNDKEPITMEIKPPKIEATEGPMIIHEETEFKPLSETKKSLKPLGGLFGFLNKKEKPEEVKPVKAEISGIDKINEKSDIKNEKQKEKSAKVKVINYTELPEPSGEPAVNKEQPITDKERPTTDNKRLITDEAEPLAVSEAEPIIIHEEKGQKPKKFFSGLSGLFSRKKTEADKSQIENLLAGESPGNAPEIAEAPAASPLIEAGMSGVESPINIIEKEAPKAELEKIKMTDIQLKSELPIKIIDEINAPQLPVEKNFFKTLIDSSKSLFIEKKKEIHYKEEIKPAPNDQRPPQVN